MIPSIQKMNLILIICHVIALLVITHNVFAFQSLASGHRCKQHILDYRLSKRLDAVTDPMTLYENDLTTKCFEIESTLRKLQSIEEKIVIKESLSLEIDKQQHTDQLQYDDFQSVFQHKSTTNRANKAVENVKVNCNERKIRNTSSRSSTMPGYRTPTNEERIDRRTFEFIESQTGRSMSKAYRRKRKSGGRNMYEKSPSVPDSLVQFANELHQEDRISAAEEIELGYRTQEAIRLHNLYSDLENRLSREPSDEEWCAAAGKINMEALRTAIEDGVEAKKKLITSNLRMVQRVVNVYIQNGLTGQYNAGDMMQDGILGLIRAAEKFEPQRGFRFSTYAMYWIRSAVKRTQTFQSRVITIPQRLHANHKRVRKTKTELQKGLGRQPTADELSNAVDMSSMQIERCIKAMDQKIFSLDQAVQNGKKPADSNAQTTLIEILESRKDDAELDQASRNFLRHDLIETLYRVLDRESAHMLVLPFGLVDAEILPDGFEGFLTIRQVSQIVGMKPDKVRRRLIRSLEILKCNIGHEWRDFERIIK